MSKQGSKVRSQSRWRISPALRDLIFVGAVALFALVFVYFLDVSGSIDWLVHRVGVLGLHDVVLTSVVVMVALALYSFRRWREAIRAEQALHLHHEMLEEMVEERMAELRQINEELEEQISERRQIEEALKESEEQFRGIASAASDAIIHMDDGGKIAYWNPAAERMFGFTSSEAIGSELHRLLSPEKYFRAFELGFKKFRETGEGPVVGMPIEMEAVRRDATEFPIEVSLSPVRIKNRWHAVGIIRDISERRKAEEVVRESEKFLNTMFHSIYDPFTIIDRKYRIVRVNEAYAQMRGKPPDQLLGAKCHEILREQKIVCEDCVVEKTFISGDPCAKEKLFELPHEGETWIEIFTHPIMNTEGDVTHVVEYIRDITGRKKADEEKIRLIKKLEYISRTDVLTGLLNRRAIIGALGSEVDRARRYGIDLSLLLCDIDYFKDANDAFGHDAGDKALVVIAGTLCSMARASDLIGRYGGDEFMLILPETGIAGAIDLAKRILETAKETEVRPFNGGTFGLSLSIGVTGFKSDRDDADTLIRRADKALYSSKRAGRGRVSVDS